MHPHRPHDFVPARLFGKSAQFGPQGGQQEPIVLHPLCHEAHALLAKADPQFGLREHLEEIGHRAGEADFDNPSGHRADIADLGEVEAERSALQLAHAALERITDRLRGQTRPAGQVEFIDAEDIARAAIGHDPAFRDAGDHLAARVESHQAGRDRRPDMLASGAQPDAFRRQFPRLGNERDIDDAIIGARAARSQRSRQEGEEPRAHDSRLAAPAPGVSRTIQSLRRRRSSSENVVGWVAGWV